MSRNCHAYFLQARKRWTCKHCKRNFYITTNTAFAFHKLPLVDILLAISLFVNEVKGISAITMSRHLNVNYKTAFVLCHKLREVLFKTRDLSPLQGEIKPNQHNHTNINKINGKNLDDVGRSKKGKLKQRYTYRNNKTQLFTAGFSFIWHWQTYPSAAY